MTIGVNGKEFDTTELTICTDCVALLANGEVLDSSGEDITSAQSDKMAALWGDTDITLGSLDCEHCGREARATGTEVESCEPWFSSSSCDGCGSPLGGDRGHAVSWTPKSNGVVPLLEHVADVAQA
jgi:hypothetical protein